MAVTKPLASGTIILGTPPEPGDNTAKVATMEAAQDLITERISSAFIYQGSTDCSTNPNYPAASAGHLYRVSVAGKIGGASGVPVGVGDFFVALEDNAGGTEAAVGTFWEVWEGNLQPGVDYNSYRAEVDKINALGDSVASDSASDIATASGDFITVSGNDPISSLGTADAGVERVLVFASTPTLTHNATSLILPTGANITCAAGDVAVMRSLGSGNWRCIDFVRASGEALTVSATSVGAAVHGATGKTTPVDADTVPLIDSAAGNVLKKLTWANIKATLKTYFDTLYAAVSHTHALASISHSGATTGQVPEWSGSAWVPATPSGGGASISLPLRAWVETTGNDGTGTVGDPSKPYQTMLAAYNAGARMMHLGAGTFAGVTKTGAIDLTYIGHGANKTTITTITSTTAGAITLRDVGGKSASIGSVTMSHPALAGPGLTGGSAGACHLDNVLVTGSLTLTGQTGSDGDATAPSAGSGGSGSYLTGRDAEVGGSIYLTCGAPGNAYNDYENSANGGSAGTSGRIDFNGTLRVIGGIDAPGGYSTGGVNGGNTGFGSSPGSVSADHLFVGGTLNLPPGEGTMAGSVLVRLGGYVGAINFDVSMMVNGEINGQCLVVPTSGNYASTGAGLVLSHINGVPVGTS